MNSKKLALHGGKPITSMPALVNSIGAVELQAAQDVIASQTLSSFRGGAQVRAFEEAFANYVGSTYAVATTSGTTALHASVAALGLKPDDEVLVPALTFVSTASVVLQEFARVVFVDIDDTFCMDPHDLERKITPNSKAVIPVHLYGQPAAMDEINTIAQKHGLVVIEDACQSHGAELNGTKTGSLGDVGCFSFYQTKNMTCGEGGMITTSNKELYEKLCLRREHGSPRGTATWYNYGVLGFNYNMTEMQGAIGQVQLRKLDEMNQKRQLNAAYYDNALAGLPLDLPKTRHGASHVRHNYPVLIPAQYQQERQFIVQALQAEGIPCDVAYPTALYETELFVSRGITGDCPVAEDFASRLITLFTDMAITSETIDNTALAFEKVFNYLAKK